MVGSYHGDDDACSTMTDVRLRKKLAPLDRMDRARETEYITNVGQLKQRAAVRGRPHHALHCADH